MRHIWAAVVLVLSAASFAQAQVYSSVVLYPLINPNEVGLINVQPRASVPGQTVGSGMANGYRALVWTGPSGTGVDLTPAGYASSFATAANGHQQVGYGYVTSGGQSQPILWTGTASSFVNLTPANFNSGGASGIDGTQQVGYAAGPAAGMGHAILWSGTPASAVDLNPTNLPSFTSSAGIGVYGNQQVGNGYDNVIGGGTHALMWTGAAASAVDLNPTGFSYSSADATCGTQQVGYGNLTSSSNANALVWSGTAGSGVDLNPAGFSNTYALGCNGQQQVGWGYGTATGGLAYDNALVWSGSAASFVDLQTMLPSTGTWPASSLAYSIDSAGNVYGDAYGTYNETTGYFAVEWSPVPEPASCGLILLCQLLLCRQARSAAARL